MADSEYSNIADATTPADAVLFPLTGILDDFNRSDDPVAPPGPSWSDVWEFVVGLAVYDNKCIQEDPTEGWGTGSNRWNTEFAADQEAYVTLTNRVGPVGTVGFSLRTTGNYYEGTFYSVHFSFDLLSGLAHVDIDKFVAGVGTTNLATLPIAMMEVGDKMGFRAEGDSLKAYYNRAEEGWVNILETTDSGYIGPGYLVLSIGGYEFQEIGDISVDDLGGGSLP